MRIAIDMDGILVEPNWNVVRFLQEHGHEVRFNDIRDWDYDVCLGPGMTALVLGAVINHPTIYRDLEPMRGAVEGVAALQAMGHEPVIVTAPMPGNAKVKMKFLEEWFSGIPVVMTRDKTLVPCDLAIEDGPKYIEAFIEAGIPVIAVQKPWNSMFLGERLHEDYLFGVTNTSEVHAWDEILDFVREIDESTTDQTILEEAAGLVTGARNKNYNHPFHNFASQAAIWSAILHYKLRPGVVLDVLDVARISIGIKLSRDSYSPKRDNWVDIAGYAYCAERCAAHTGDFPAAKDEDPPSEIPAPKDGS
jgi:5'(3')-deoxyribonucleotidase